MAEVVRDLTDADIDALAEYYAAKPFAPNARSVNRAG